jgi:hypothetical protein
MRKRMSLQSLCRIASQEPCGSRWSCLRKPRRHPMAAKKGKKSPAGKGGSRAQVSRTQRSLLAMGRARAIMVLFGAGRKLV